MKFVFRTDASVEIGTGHVMRCLTLADALRERGAQTLFICRPHRGHMLEQIRARGHELRVMSPAADACAAASAGDTPHSAWLGVQWDVDARETLQLIGGERVDWLVVDHYALDRRWERELRQACRRIMIMDDLADRSHDCDLLLDPTLGRKHADYTTLVSRNTKMFSGPQYALVRPEFAMRRAESLARRVEPELRHLLVTMGGIDKGNATGLVLDALDVSSLPPHLRVTVVMGTAAPWLSVIQERASKMRLATDVRVRVDNMAGLMANSDLAIGAAGGTSWERCCMGLPTIQLVLAANQKVIADRLASVGAVTYANEITLRKILETLSNADWANQLADQSRIASKITDGLGAERMAENLLGFMW